MKLILISDNGRRHKKFNLDILSMALFFLSMTLLLAALMSFLNNDKSSVISDSEIRLLNKFDLMLLKTAKLEGQVKRLNSLGKTIAEKNNIDIQAYLLSQAPAMGGLGNSSDGRSTVLTKENLSKSISHLELELELQEQRYTILNSVDKNKHTSNFDSNQNPDSFLNYSTPVLKGYISSTFGNRRDPINGHQRHHNGIDIAAKYGSKIHTIASGFVTFSGRKGGYGNVIDIHHSDSLKSRYAHLDSIKVKKGEVVRKGDIIATMGKTGRATGSHLHIEVWEKDQAVNPESYIDTALIKEALIK